jgi:putative addiction module component (TIGR02574 family)
MPAISLSAITALSVPERIQLVEDIWDSIAAYPEAVEVTDFQKAELDQRLAAFEADPASGNSWNEVRGRLWQLV